MTCILGSEDKEGSLFGIERPDLRSNTNSESAQLIFRAIVFMELPGMYFSHFPSQKILFRIPVQMVRQTYLHALTERKHQ